MKKISAIIVALALIVLGVLLLPTEANAAKLGNLTYTIEEEEVTITACNTKQSGDLVIPEQIDGCPVTTIAENAFKGCDKITSVTIPSTLKSVGASAFDGCTALTGVYISDLAAWCEIDFYNIMSSPLDTAKKLYLNGELVTDLVIPEGVTIVKDYTFIRCDDLKSVVIPDGVTALENAFMYCTGLTAVSIADSVQEIESTFSGCTALTEVRLPDSLTRLDAAFMNCTSLRSVSNLNNITFIANYSFYKCAALTAITIPDTVTSINYYAFAGCTSLTEIVIPDNVTSVGHNAFNGCTALKTLTIGSSVESLNDKTFYNCTALETIYFNATALKGLNIKSTFNNVGKSSAGLVVYIGANVTKLPSGLFMPFSGTSHEAPAITEVIFAEGSVCEIFEGSIFRDCKSLIRINLPDGLKRMGDFTFYGCTALREIDIPDSVEDIGDYTFSGCTALTKADLPAAITTIGTRAFYKCSSLSEMSIPEGVSTIEDSAFYGCTSLAKLTVPASLTTIGKEAFYDCMRLADVYITDANAWCRLSLEETYSNPALYVSRLHILDAQGQEVTKLTLDESLTQIRSRAFYRATNLTSVTIPDSITSIGFLAFGGCDNLNHVLYTGGEDQWNMINIDWDNDILYFVTLHYNCTGEEIADDGTCAICEANILHGDSDDNGTVDEVDVIYLLKHLLMPEDFTVSQKVDYDKSGAVDEYDVIYLLQHVLMPEDFPL